MKLVHSRISPSRLLRYAPLLGYFFVIMLVFGGALFPSQGKMIFGDDIHRQYYFYREFFNTWIGKGVLPLWNPYYFAGAPYLANAIVNLWYPPTWLYSLLPLPLAYAWHMALHVGIAMVGMYWLLRLLQCSRIPAWCGGIVFGLSGFFMARVWEGHVDVIAAASWMPWVFGAFWQVIFEEKLSGKRIVFAASVLAIQLSAGYQTIAFFTLEAIGIVVLLACVKKRSLLPVVGIALACILASGLAGLQLVPEQELMARNIRTFPKPYSWAAYGSLIYRSLEQLIQPFFFGDKLTYHGPPPNYAEQAMFVGRIPLMVILLGIGGFLLGLFRVRASGEKSQQVVIFGTFIGIVFFSVWVSLGPNAPVDLQRVLWTFVPIYKYLRIPPRHLVLFVFGSAALTGLYLDGLLRLVKQRRGIIGIIVGAAITAELVFFGQHFIHLEDIPETRHDKELITMLQGSSEREPFRVLPEFGVWIPPRDSFDFDSALSYGIFSASGYEASILRNYYEFIDAANKTAEPSILMHDVQIPFLYIFSPFTDFLNIKYILVPREYDPLFGIHVPKYRLLREDMQRDYRVYENTGAFPRFFLVPALKVFPTREQVASAIRAGRDNPRDVVYAVKDSSLSTASFHPTCAPGDAADIQIVSYTPNKIILDVDFPCNGFLASSEVMYSGWRASVDGVQTDMFEGNLAFRTLFIAKGKHTVTMWFAPLVFYAGGVLSLVSFGIAVLLWRKQ